MERTLQDYAKAVPLGRITSSWCDLPDASIESVTARDSRVVATVRWEKYRHPILSAMEPGDVDAMDEPVDEVPLDLWADEAVLELTRNPSSPLWSSRRSAAGDAIEVVETAPWDPRFAVGRYLADAGYVLWPLTGTVANLPTLPASVEGWRRDGTLLSCHAVGVQHSHPLPPFGHAATRWVGDGVASVDFLELDPGLPDTFGLLAVADAVHTAAVRGAHTLRCTVDVPHLSLLGFQRSTDGWTVDDRFLDVDHAGIADIVAATSGWAPPPRVEDAIAEADARTYDAG